jgi:hypothetical protein
MPMPAHTVRYSDEENIQVKRRMRRLGYTRVSAFLKEAGLGFPGRDASDGFPGWCHDVTTKLNAILHDPDDVRLRLDLMDVARRIEKALEAIKDLAAKSEKK